MPKNKKVNKKTNYLNLAIILLAIAIGIALLWEAALSTCGTSCGYAPLLPFPPYVLFWVIPIAVVIFSITYYRVFKFVKGKK